MSDPGEAHDLAALARSRWPTLVRTAVLLGMTLPAARGLAGRTVAEVSGRSSGYEGLDPEVELFGALVDGHRGETSAWWREPPDPARAVGEAVLEAEAVLDVLSREARERVVLEVVALLAPEQLDEVVPAPAEPGPANGLAGPTSEQRFLVERAAASLDVGAPAVAEVTGDRRRAAASVLAGVLLAALGLGGAVVAAQRLADDVPLAVDETDRRPSAPFTGSVNTAVVPVGWYAAGVLRLGEASVSLDDVETLASLPTGAVVVTGRGVVLAVDELGATTRLGRTRPGARVVTSPDGRVAFGDSQGPTQVSVLDLGGGHAMAGSWPSPICSLRSPRKAVPRRFPMPRRGCRDERSMAVPPRSSPIRPRSGPFPICRRCVRARSLSSRRLPARSICGARSCGRGATSFRCAARSGAKGNAR